MGNIQGVRVLLVEDNGQEGVDAAKRNQFAAVLRDIQMPVMDGHTATRQIRKDERLKELPIIAMAAHAMSIMRPETLSTIESRP